MKIKITIIALDDDGNELHCEQGMVEDINRINMESVAKWFMEQYISVKMKAIFRKENG